MDEETSAPMLNNRLVVIGGVLTVVGDAIGMVGTTLVGVAITSVVRQWAQSEQRQQLVAKARMASTAAASAWKGPREIRVPERGQVPVG